MSIFLFTPGPTQVPYNILKKFSRPPIHHRSGEFLYLHQKITYYLKKVFKTEGEIAIFSASGTGAMEAAAMNFISAGDKAACMETGKFGRRWSEICRRIDAEVIPIEIELGKPLNPTVLKSVLKKHPDIKAVFMTEVESSTGALYDIKELTEVVKKNSNALVIVDVICALAADEFSQDEWNVDVAVAASQKAFMCPPGLSFVSVSPEGLKHLKRPKSLYWDIEYYIESGKTGDPPFTPAINIFPALSEALMMISHMELDEVIRRTANLAGAFRQAAIVGGLKIFPVNPASALTVIELPDNIIDTDVAKNLKDRSRFRIAPGQDSLSGKIIRIAHLGAIGFPEVKRLIPPLFETLEELGLSVNPEYALETFIEEYEAHK